MFLTSERFLKMKSQTKIVLGLTLGGLIGAGLAWAGPPSSAARITNDDFIRSDRFLRGTPETDILNGDIDFRWIDQGGAFYYRSQRADGTRYLLVESATGKKTPLFDHQVMASALSKALNAQVSANALPIDRLIRQGKESYEVVSGKKTLLCDLTAQTCSEGTPKQDPTETPSPDGRYTLFSRDYDIWLRDSRSGEERPLTQDGVRGWSYGLPPESSLNEVSYRRTGEKFGVAALWSPDGRRFLSYQLDEREVKEMALIQNVPEDGSFRPKVHTYHYELLGDEPSEASFFIYDVEKNARIPIDYRKLPSTTRVPLALSHMWWRADGQKLYLLDAPLTQPFMKLLEVEPATGAARLLVEEHAENTYFPNTIRIAPPNVRVLKNGDVIWFSERDGWGHLYLHDGRTGKVKHAITKGEWLVRDILRLDEREGYIYFSASGRESGEDLYNRHLYRIRLDGAGLKLLTPEPGDHDFPPVVSAEMANISSTAKNYFKNPPRLSPDGKYVIDHFSTVQAPGRWVLRRKDGSIVARLEEEDPSRLPPYTQPEPFVVKSADGSYDLYGVLNKPRNFDPDKKYAVVDNIYPGPQTTKAPKTFAGGGLGYNGSAIFGEAQALADLGFVAIRVDGRGGMTRSKAFRDLSYRHMEKAGMLEDHMAALRQLAKTRPWLDLDRVGMFGTSGGGFATAHALIDYPDFFKVGVSCAGNHDQRSYVRMWGETYHGPVESTDYAKVFTGRDVSRFKGKLLLVHGDMDDNVHPANTMRLVDALIKGNKQFDMLILPNVNHNIETNPYYERITQNYFLKHLMGAQLPSDSDIVLPGSARPDIH